MTISEYPRFYSLSLSSVVTSYHDPELIFQAFLLDIQSVVFLVFSILLMLLIAHSLAMG